MKIGIIGTRGIPNRYGGFEQFADYISREFVKNGHDVSVYNGHDHEYQEKDYGGVHLIHKWSPDTLLGTAGQFIYDALCIIDSRKRNFDIILELGYTSSSISYWLHPKSPVIITNMDGLEWKRSKYSDKVKKFLKFAEKLAVKKSDVLVSDSIGIKKYLSEEYDAQSTFIPYAATVFTTPNDSCLNEYSLTAYNYDMLVARLEPENSIETLLEGRVQSKTERDFIVVGNVSNEFGKKMQSKYGSSKIHFIGGVYNQEVLNNLRYYSNIYFHGHTVGGTNPSLLEAMASNTLICAHDNEFNSTILGDDAFYFSSSGDISEVLGRVIKHGETLKTGNNTKKIEQNYSVETIAQQYLKLFKNS